MSSVTYRSLRSAVALFAAAVAGSRIVSSAGQDRENTHWIVRAPASFRALPLEIRRKLERDGCSIPQSSQLRFRHNVISGEFLRRGRREWAVLCVRQNAGRVEVFWTRGEADSETLPLADAEYQPGSWIKTATPAYIRRHLEAYGSAEDIRPDAVNHDGIELGFDCCSIVFYRHEGRWLRLPGAD